MPRLDELIVDLLQRLKRGDCWCETGVGNPMMKGEHSPVCHDVQALLRGLSPRPDVDAAIKAVGRGSMTTKQAREIYGLVESAPALPAQAHTCVVCGHTDRQITPRAPTPKELRP